MTQRGRKEGIDMQKFIMVLIAAIFTAMLRAASPLLRKAIEDFLDKLEELAAGTDNKFDDALVQLLKELLKADG